ncbi:rRNA 2'-O-methyltransferase fibrillarin-like [Anopheles bellator]|uniref:rRNA 2'-O-methyltransferase fibrillarin-like n=1 Tax=Anopheles bellator TaxID=139047 RepID=UPI0026471C05|nr:rRNA 2'-O-methyltransferase fibrillarin-like [Anopheles bellator]
MAVIVNTFILALAASLLLMSYAAADPKKPDEKVMSIDGAESLGIKPVDQMFGELEGFRMRRAAPGFEGVRERRAAQQGQDGNGRGGGQGGGQGGQGGQRGPPNGQGQGNGQGGQNSGGN